MLFNILLPLVLVSSVLGAPHSKDKDHAITSYPSLPFNISHLFHATINLEAAPAPVPIFGGVLVTKQILNGTVSGPALNGTIKGGLAHPSVYLSGTLQFAALEAYGTTSDGLSFFISESGVGSGAAQLSVIVSLFLLCKSFTWDLNL